MTRVPSSRLRSRLPLPALLALPLLVHAGPALAAQAQAGAPVSAHAGETSAPVRWAPSRAFPGLGEAHAVAVDAARGRVAAGGEDGVWLAEDGAPARRAVARGPVRDLAFDAEGALWIAGDEGLYRLGRDGRLADRTPGPGETVRQVRRIAAEPGLLVCGTAGGLFASRDGAVWIRLDAGLPDGDVTALALAGAGPGAFPSAGRVLWAVVDEELVRAALRSAPEIEVTDVTRPTLAEADRPVDVLAAPPGGEVAVLGESTLSLLRPGLGWETHRPALPPGSATRRLAAAQDRLWIATDAGLLELRQGRFARAEGTAGSESVFALAAGAGRLFAAAERGVLEALVAAPAPAIGAAGSSEVAPTPEAPPPDLVARALARLSAGEPAVGAVQRAALRYLDLEPARIRSLARGARRAGWLPVVRLDGAYGGSRGETRDWDQAFTSGDYRFLYDRGRDRDRDFDVALQLTWNLGLIAYHPESIDASSEARQLVKLRDQVLDEVVQLYFERRRALLALAALAGADPLEAADLRLRADELAAGLDAWTGGWWSRQVAPLASPSPFSALSPPVPDREKTP